MHGLKVFTIKIIKRIRFIHFQFRIVDVLDAFMNDKFGDSDTDDASSYSEIHGLRENFPKDIQLQHAVCTWKAMVDFCNRQPQH